jgi:microcystin-dependent protein
MSNQFLAEVRIFPFNFAPLGWAFCDGQIMPISQNTALFSLLGTTYGGNGSTTYALPNMQGNAPMHPGQGPGLSQYVLGETGGSTNVTLQQQQMPLHGHPMNAEARLPAATKIPGPTMAFARTANNVTPYETSVTSNVTLAPTTIGPSGNNAPHNNMMPYLTLNFCIALQGVYPQRG